MTVIFNAANILASLSDNSPDEAFIRENGKTFLQFDKIEIRPLLNGIDAEFWWRGKLVNTMHCTEPLKLGMSLTLSGMTGRMEVNLF